MPKNLSAKKMRFLSTLMLVANLISGLFYSLSYPYIYQEMCRVISERYISFESILACLSTIIFCRIWNKHSDKLFRFYRIILWSEMILDIILFGIAMFSHNLKVYFIMNILIYALITRNLACGGVRMRAKVNPDEKSRERYDNNSNIVSSIATLAGASVIMFKQFDLNMLFIFALIGNIIDNIFYLFIYREIIKK